MDIPQKLRDVLTKDGVVAIATQGPDGPHMVNTCATASSRRRRTHSSS